MSDDARCDLRSLVVFHMGGVGGPLRSLGGAVGWLRDHGTVEFVLPEEGAAVAACAEHGPVTVADYTVLTYARRPPTLLRMARDLRADVRFFRTELRRRQTDLVVAVTTVLPALLIAARLEHVPAVVYAAELYRQRWKRAPMFSIWGAVLARGTGRLSDGIVSCSTAVSEQFPRHSSKPHAVAYPPIGHEYADGDRARARARYGLGAEDFCIAVVGNLSRGRGQDVAIRALEPIRERAPSARLLIVGDAHPRRVDRAFEEELRSLAGAAGESAVIIAPATDDVAGVYAAADVVVNPARFEEPFGRVAPEALVARRPVVASRVGAIPEVLRDGVDGLLVSPDDPAALAEGVCRVAADPALAERLVTNGRAAVLARFTQAQDRISWAAVLEAALARPRGPRRLRVYGARVQNLDSRSGAGTWLRRRVRRVVDSSAWWWLTRRAAGRVIPAGLRRHLRRLADRIGWWWLRRLPRGELKARERASWRDESPGSGLTWVADITGDAFIEKARSYGLGGTVLEIGPGYGRLPEAAARLDAPFRRWIGVDLSPHNVAHLEQRFGDERFRFMAADAETLTLDERVDAIVSSLTLKHVFPTFEAVLRNLSAILQPDGVVIIDLIEGSHLRHFEPLRGNFIRSYERPEIAEIFGRCGLRVEAFDNVDHSDAPEHRRLLVVGRRAN
jgi:glycosyltransferase involved in cell wall biosynthesis/SAM-dependent methyltransferase